jgi:hypothetical protein
VMQANSCCCVAMSGSSSLAMSHAKLSMALGSRAIYSTTRSSAPDGACCYKVSPLLCSRLRQCLESIVKMSVVRAALSIEILPNITRLPVLESTSPLFIFCIAIAGDGILSTGNGAIASSRRDIAGDLYAFHGAITSQQCPFFALPVVLENAYTIFAPVTALFDSKRATLLDAIFRSRIGDLSRALLRLRWLRTALGGRRRASPNKDRN